MTRIDRELVREAVVAAMSFYEGEVIDIVWDKVKDRAMLPVENLQEEAQRLADLTAEALREVLRINGPDL